MHDNEAFSDGTPDRTRRVGREPASQAVVRAVATARDRDPLELPPLHEVIDPDALDELFADTLDGRSRDGRLVFEYAGCTVTLRGPDEVVVDVDR